MNAMMKDLRDAREARVGPPPVPQEPTQAERSVAEDSAAGSSNAGLVKFGLMIRKTEID
jgi:hypothetical protein